MVSRHFPAHDSRNNRAGVDSDTNNQRQTFGRVHEARTGLQVERKPNKVGCLRRIAADNTGTSKIGIANRLHLVTEK